MKDSKKDEDKQVQESNDDIQIENKELVLQKMEEIMQGTEFIIKEFENNNIKIPDQKDVEFKMLSHATLISIIKDLQTIGIEGKNPKKVLKELKKLRASRE